MTELKGTPGIWEGMEVCLPPETSLEQWFDNHWTSIFNGKRLYRESDVRELIRKIEEATEK